MESREVTGSALELPSVRLKEEGDKEFKKQIGEASRLSRALPKRWSLTGGPAWEQGG